MPTLTPKRILIAPLDWGLGHTARCVPVISYLQALGHIPVVAGNAAQRSFIEETFGGIDIIHLDGYNITYSAWNRFAQAGLLAQLPGIHKTINNEHKWLQQLSRHIHIDGIISDNRYGLHHPCIPSVIMTHQLHVQTGMGSGIDRTVQQLHYKYLGRFNATWVVDNAGLPNLAGKLSHTGVLPVGAKYIGLLSRFEGLMKGNATGDSLLILLSGPEPQRSALSRLLWQQALGYNGKVIFIEGSDSVATPVVIPHHITYYKRLAGEKLFHAFNEAGMVVCRSGYSTIMDLVALGKKAILIPTPGQTEQEYLARHLHGQGIFYAVKQDGFNLGNALRGAQQFPYFVPGLGRFYTGYKEVVREWVEESLRTRDEVE